LRLGKKKGTLHGPYDHVLASVNFPPNFIRLVLTTTEMGKFDYPSRCVNKRWYLDEGFCCSLKATAAEI